MFKIRYIYNILKFLALIIVLYNEYLAYLFLLFAWPTLLPCNSETCVKILLVADPQILGEQDSSWIARWDCDRYLQKTFGYALKFTQPDIVIFLGDVMDEGHIASNDQFIKNLQRFRNIFHVPKDSSNANPMVIYIPGDNDIGGEGDPILPHVVHRFDKVFQETVDPVAYQNLEFYKVNKMTAMFQEPEVLTEGIVRIALSHMPILRKFHTLSKQIGSKIQPHIVFSGHDHNSMHITAPSDDVWQKTINPFDPAESSWHHYTLHQKNIHEFIIPTCSYRMGVLNMGFGVALIDHSSNIISYNTLWLPHRLSHLVMYLWFLIFLAFFGFCWGLFSIHRRVRRLTRSWSLKTYASYQHLP